MLVFSEVAESLRPIHRHLLACAVAGVASIAGASEAIVTAPPVTQAVGTIRGTVTNAVTAAPISDVGLSLFDASGQPVAHTLGPSRFDGTYELHPPAPGLYFVFTSYALSFVPELYNDLLCFSVVFPPYCDLEAATLVEVPTDGSDVEGIDFELEPGGRIDGQVTEEGSGDPIYVLIMVYDTIGRWLAGGYVDLNFPGGGYTTTPGLPSGSYFVTTYNTWDGDGGVYVDEAWDDHVCMDPFDYGPFELGACDPTSATPIGVVAGVTTTGIDFELRRGGFISGHVTSVVGGAALGSVKAEVFTSAGYLVTEGSSLIDGSWEGDWSLPTGGYYVRFSRFGYEPVLYPGIASDLVEPCAPCDVFDGTLVNVTYGQVTPGIDIALVPLDWLFGSGFEGGGLGDWDSASP